MKSAQVLLLVEVFVVIKAENYILTRFIAKDNKVKCLKGFEFEWLLEVK